MTTTVIIRNFTGSTSVLQVDTSSKVSEVKEQIARKVTKGTKPAISYKGHELRDDQTLSYYGIADQHVLSLLPPSKAPKTLLHFEKSDGSHFTLHVNSDITVAQLRNDVAIEKNMDVRALKFILSLEDQSDPDALVISEARDLPDHALISDYPLTDATIFIYGPPPPEAPPSKFNVLIRLCDGRKLHVETNLHQTLHEFKSAVQHQHNVSIANDVLIFVGRELTGDDRPLWDLDLVPECTVHAVPFTSLRVEIPGRHTFDSMLFHPLTRLSAVRKRLQLNAPPHLSLDKYWFTRGNEHLRDSLMLWDLDLISADTMLYMRTSTISVTVMGFKGDPGKQIDVEEDETVWGLKERWALTNNTSISAGQRVFYRGKILDDTKTVKEEGLVGGEQLLVKSRSAEAHESLGLDYDM